MLTSKEEAIEWQRPYLGNDTGFKDADGKTIHVGDKLHLNFLGDEYTAWAIYQDLENYGPTVRKNMTPSFQYGKLDIIGSFHPFGDSEGRLLKVVESWEVLNGE